MCGIAGIHHSDATRPVDRAALTRMATSLVHRGPDGEGFHVEPGVGLAHRRLSIIDLASGQQPLCNEDGSVWVTFNGEIFNYLELRDELKARGHVFRTQSDTETLVHAYEEYGLDFVEQLNGQFAFALWDSKQRRLVLARDRVGIRPLYHATLPDGTLLFASECKALFAHGGISARIDATAVAQIATLWVSVPPRTAFEGVQELPAGHLMVLEGGKSALHRYWDLQFPDSGDYETADADVWASRVRETLADSVRLQLRADVPVASYLSGGLDSSILASLVKRHHNNELITFSVGFEDAAFDERQFQRTMVAALGTDHREIAVGAKDIGRAFFESVWWAERPLTRSAPAPLLDLAGLVHRNGIKVVLTGEGADEIFGGYNIFREDKVRRFWARQPESKWRPALLSRLYGYVKRDPRAEAMWREFFRGDLTAVDDPFYSHRIRWANTSGIRRLFAPDFASTMPTPDEILEDVSASIGRPDPKWHPLACAQFLELKLFMSGYLLSAQGDRMMMAHSVEGRVPFLDHRVIELAARIPPQLKLRGLNEKFILKHAYRDLLPPTIAQRPKQPYRAPISACFRPETSALGARLIGAEALKNAGYFEPATGSRLVQKTLQTDNVNERDEMAIALMASLQSMHEQFAVSPP